MLQFYIYNSATGQVLARAFYDEIGDGAAARAVGTGIINPSTEYAPAGVKTARPVFVNLALDKLVIAADGIDGATITNVPASTVVKVFKDQDKFPRGVVTVNDGSFVLKVDTAGTYRLVLSNFPTQDATFTVQAT